MPPAASARSGARSHDALRPIRSRGSWPGAPIPAAGGATNDVRWTRRGRGISSRSAGASSATASGRASGCAAPDHPATTSGSSTGSNGCATGATPPSGCSSSTARTPTNRGPASRSRRGREGLGPDGAPRRGADRAQGALVLAVDPLHPGHPRDRSDPPRLRLRGGTQGPDGGAPENEPLGRFRVARGRSSVALRPQRVQRAGAGANP